VETVRTLDTTGTAAINLTGNELNNTLIDDDAANILNGGAGADTMYGYAGNDSYYVDNAGDRVMEAADGGADTVYTSVSWIMTAGQEIETLRAQGSTAISLTGNAFNNTLVGNSAN